MENKKTLEDALAHMEANKKRIADYQKEFAAEIEAESAKRRAFDARMAALTQEERREVLNAAGMRHISAAPPPLEPLRGSSYSPPSKPTAPPIDWEHWGLMLEVPLWHAVALSVNINPEVVKLDRAGEAFDSVKVARAERRKQARKNKMHAAQKNAARSQLRKQDPRQAGLWGNQ